jgi:hypothetical protein
MDENTESTSSDSVEIIGLSDSPVVVNSDLSVTQSAAAGEQDVMADMKAAVAADAPVAKDETQTAKDDEPPAAKVEDGKPEEKPADKVDDAPAEKPADEKAPEVKTEEKDDAKPKEGEGEEETPELTDDEKAAKEAEAKAEEEKVVLEPSESDKLVEELGGVEVLKAVQPFVESIYDPALTVSERVSRLEAVVPEVQMKEIRNEVFWQGAETPEIQEILKSDPEIQNLIATDPVAREAFAQKAFGVPFDYLMLVLNEDREDKNVLDEKGFDAAVADFAARHKVEATGEANTPAKPAIKAEAKTEKPAAKPDKTDEKKTEEAATEFTPAYLDILGDLTKDVDVIYATAQLDPDDKDDADTARLKSEAATKFGAEWSKAFLADEAAKKALTTVKGLADQGAVVQAKHKYATLSANAKRVAAQLLAEVTKPLTEHRSKLQEKGKAAAAARTETKAAANTKTFEAPKTGVDVSKLTNDDEVLRAMQESVERHSKG